MRSWKLSGDVLWTGPTSTTTSTGCSSDGPLHSLGETRCMLSGEPASSLLFCLLESRATSQSGNGLYYVRTLTFAEMGHWIMYFISICTALPCKAVRFVVQLKVLFVLTWQLIVFLAGPRLLTCGECFFLFPLKTRWWCYNILDIYIQISVGKTMTRWY